MTRTFSSVAARLPRLAGLGLVLAAAPWILSVGLGACSDAAESTAGRRVTLEAEIGVDTLSFTNGYGFAVELDRVLVSVGELRYFEGAPVAGKSVTPRARLATRPALETLLGLSTAHAHPGHYQEGGTIGEMLTPVTVSLAEGAATLGSGNGITGAARSARFSYQSPPLGALASELDPHVVLLSGTAKTATEERAFVAIAEAEDVLDELGQPWVTGCAFQNGRVDNDGVVKVTLHPSVWLDQVDFAEIEQRPPSDPIVLPRDGLSHKAFARGLKKAAAYAFEYFARDQAR